MLLAIAIGYVEVQFIFLSFNELCWEKAMVAYKKPQQRHKDESKRLRGERHHIKFMNLRFEIWQVVRFRKARRQDFPQSACSWENACS